jgi:ribosomal protein S18 acetylase RimI-like enzyme
MIFIREFCYPQDYSAVRALWENIERGVRLGRSDTAEEIQKKAAYNPDLFLLAETDDHIVGTVIGGYDGRRGLLYHLAVAQEYRHQGIGGKLMDEIENRLRARGCLKCYLLVTTENDKAMHYYEKRGWERMEAVRLYGKEFR